MTITPTTPVLGLTPYGKLYVAVAPADPHSYHNAEHGDVTDLRPMLWIASDPAFEADPDAADHWTIRGRAYAVHYHVFFEDRTAVEYPAGHKGERWHRDGYTPYAGGFRNDRRGPVEFQTKTYDLMWDAVTTALDAFAEQHPKWADLSHYLMLWSGADSAYAKALDLRKEADKLSAKADVLEGKAGAIAATLPGALLSLYPAEEN